MATIDTGAVMQVLEPEWRDEGADPIPSAGPNRADPGLCYSARAGAAARTRPAGVGTWTSSCPRPRSSSRFSTIAAVPWADSPCSLATTGQTHRSCRPCSLQFLLLTAVRRGEALEARWDEIDTAAAVWTVPAGQDEIQPRAPSAIIAACAWRDLTRIGTELGATSCCFPGFDHGRPIAATVPA